MTITCHFANLNKKGDFLMNEINFIDLQQTRFHVNTSKKLLLELKLKPYNIPKEALDIIAESFDILLLNLENLLKGNSTEI